jgi:RHS repeat-associated protein
MSATLARVRTAMTQQLAAAPQSESMAKPPAISLPASGGAIRGLGETFTANVATGTAALSIPIGTSPGRAGFSPQLSLSYDSANGNGPFGFGWTLAIPSVTRKTDRGLPRYDETDVFLLSGFEDLVGVPGASPAPGYKVDRFRPRTEGAMARIERWIRLSDGDTHWRVSTKDNLTSWYGEDVNSRVHDPAEPGKVFSWLISRSYDDKGNVLVYEYAAEDSAGVDLGAAHEQHRTAQQRTANRYLKRVRYGNRVSYLADPELNDPQWMFETVLDYGEHPEGAYEPARPWPVREDPFSQYRPGFEVRSYRLCQRVLMFHHFPQEPGIGQGCLVSATEFGYEAGQATGSFLVSASVRGWRGNVSRSMPPLEISYTKAELRGEIGVVPGVAARDGQWIDLDGEGIAGLLSEHQTGWHYRANLGGGKLAAARTVSPVPVNARAGQTQLLDLAGDGQLDVVTLDGPVPGFHERADQGWTSFVPFRSLPQLDWAGARPRFVDLSGDGLADLMLTEHDAVLWHPSLGEQGFGPAVRVSQSAEPDESLQLADMSGDGLVDLVRVRNGEVCYWPNLGYGRFGDPVRMDHAPYFCAQELFDPGRVRLGDLDGSGVTDVIYLAGAETLVFFNRSGNSFAPAQRLPGVPVRAQATDLLGTGTSCLVWPSEAPGDTRLFYLDPLGGVKPHLLHKLVNNLGGESTYGYAASTRFYLADAAAGRPWRTRLPFPVQVLTSVEQRDRIAGTHFVTRYSYHDGLYDGVEREFRGFGEVEQWDTDEIPSAEQGIDVMPTVLTRTWFHTGLSADGGDLPDGLSVTEEREAWRAMRGMPLRQEVYALDGSDAGERPYHVARHRYGVRRLAPRVYLPYQTESLTEHHDRAVYEVDGELVPDPRIVHELALDVDDWGNVLRQASVAYGRRHPGTGLDPRLPEWAVAAVVADQRRQRVRIRVAGFTNAIDTVGTWRAPAGYRSEEFDLVVASPVDEIFTAAELLAGDGPANRELIAHRVSLMGRDDLTGPLPEGVLESLGLAYETYELALTETLRAELFDRAGTDLAPGARLIEAGYVARPGGWWSPSGRTTPDPAHFYMPSGSIDPFGNTHQIRYDAYDLLVVGETDAVGNQSTATPDYRVLQPWRVTDVNGNRSSVLFDALGLVVATSISGKEGEDLGDSLEGLAPDLTPEVIAQYLADPAALGDVLLGPATTRVVNDPFAYHRTRDSANPEPVVAATLTRDLHQHQGDSPGVRHVFSYADGGGQGIQQKFQAENGNWLATGWSVQNNKGLPVRVYEPFFSDKPGYQPGNLAGVSTVTCYDPAGVAVATLHPDGSYEKGRMTPWARTLWDRNDTALLDPRTDPDVLRVAAAVLDDLPPQWQTWHARRIAGLLGPAAQEAATAVAGHAGTPQVTYLDPLGRTVLTMQDNGSEVLATHALLDLEGTELQLTGPDGRVALTSRYDLLGNAARQVSADAGESFELTDVLGEAVFGCDARGVQITSAFDALRRLVTARADGKLVRRNIWGETHPQAEAFNLRGELYKSFDEAGLATTLACDFKGNVVHSSRRLIAAWQSAPDWEASPALGDEFESRAEFDARNRPILTTTPDGSQVRQTYNEAGLLERVDTRPAAGAWTPVVTGIAYTARRERERLDYGNGSHVVNEYDPLSRVLVRRTSVSAGTVVQDLRYTYDPRGNLTHTIDDAQPTIFFNGAVVTSASSYVYDPVYRLVEANGREHAGQQSEPDWRDTGRSGLPHPHDAQAMRRYTQRFTYDRAGNLRTLAHLAGGSGWTRDYTYPQAQNNRLGQTQTSGGAVQPYTYDDAGNMTSMPHLAALGWDHVGQLASVDRGGGGMAYYQYSAAGQRTRKVLQRQNGSRSAERLYLNGFELYREYDGSGQNVTLARTTLRIDGLCLIETRTLGTDDSPAQVMRYQVEEHLSAAAIELDATGQVLSYEEYYPFGAASFASHRGSTAGPAKRYRYAGRERDEETGLSYHGARYYAPWLARWISVDPLGARTGELTGYVYCANRPTTLIDPSGGQPAPAPHTLPNGGGWQPWMDPHYDPNAPRPQPQPRPRPRIRPSGPRPTPRVGPKAGPKTFLPKGRFSPRGFLPHPVLVFVEIMLTPTNKPHTNTWTDPDTQETHEFSTYEARDAHIKELNKWKEEQRQAPGPDDKKDPVEAPGPQKDPVEAPGPDPQAPPKIAPGPSDAEEKKAPPAEERDEAIEAMPTDRPLTDPERADVLKTIQGKKQLSTAQRDLLRAEARWMWKNATQGKGPQPGKTHQLHHLIPLEHAHIAGEYPNNPNNLYLMKEAEHTFLHRAMRLYKGPITADVLKKMRENVVEGFKGKRLSNIKQK